MLNVIAIVYLALLGTVYSAVTPTGPGPNEIFREGQPCKISWNLDTSNKWKSFSVDLMSGSNFNMNVVKNVFKGMDGTKGPASYSAPCSKVTPNSAIYFYQFNQAGEEPAWTTRFTIASLAGKFTAPANATQPDHKPIPWGVAALS
ncbi:hypothetical protein PtA15_4A260 [Puccinia triticina]|uniref:Yeast cell wall synthesis Kre9/Knh1-like N-terminal domain-containing protein n=1 Tax=Puccinia triticina TaxID=208348 RepID=A0ABY7CF25_9BASI|nr:uncharacterized protein PtA15_4A260 [Puccinia triticina]WAQ83811.1 hypothetical protein PtA15_4A260 [Puccinia triticina]